MLVQEAYGSGDAAGSDARITELVSQAPFDVYVAVLGTPADVPAGTGDSDYLATALSRRIGEPGLYLVIADGSTAGLRVIGTEWDETLFSLQRFRDVEAVTEASGDDVLEPGVLAEVVVRTAVEAEPVREGETPTETVLSEGTVAELAQRQAALQPFALPDYEDDDSLEPWGTGKRWMVGTTVGLGLLVLLLQSLRGWPGWRRTTRASGRPQAAPPDPVAARAEAEATLERLARQLSGSVGRAGHEDAAQAREAAELLLGSDDPLDLVGAQVLARAGQRALQRRGPAPLAVCFFDPRHTGSLRELDERYGDADLFLTVCRTCERAVTEGAEPVGLVVRAGLLRRTRPYYEGDSVWARTGYGTLSTGLGTFVREVLTDLEARR